MSTTPRRLSKYELQKLLGHGSTGEVWKGYDLQARRNVTVKLLHPDLIQNDPNFMAYFMKEWQLLINLHHPNIVQVYEVNISRPSDSIGTTPYIVMDYVEGQSLADYIQHTSRVGNFPLVADIVKLFTSIAAAIDYAHEQYIYHNDIKPTNILLDKSNSTNFPGGEPKLTDFGIANLPGNRQNTSTLYISPEQVKAQPANPRSDVYALGVILYEMCTGVLPFHGESNIAIMMHHINTLPTPPMLINPHIPLALSEVILRAMAKDPNTRYPTATVLASAIAEACSIEQAPHLTLNKKQPAGSPSMVGIPLTGTLGGGTLMTSILGVSQPLPDISSQHPTLAEQETLSISSTDKNGIPPMAPASSRAPTPSMAEVAGASAATTIHAPMRQHEAPISGPLMPSSFSQNSAAHRLSLSPPAPAQQNTAIVPISTSSKKLAVPPVVQPADFKFRSSTVLSPIAMAIIILLLLLVVVGALGASFLLHSSGTPPISNGGHVYFQDDALGRNDVLRIDIQNMTSPPQGKSYYAWSQDTSGQAVPLGPLTVQHGSATLLYMGDAHHTNLLSTIQSVFVTLEDNGNSTPSAPTTSAKVYQGTFVSASFPYIQHVLYQLPNFPANTNLIAGLFEAIKGINDKAVSVADTLQGKHDYPLAQRQATRIIEMIDGTQFARSSGDLPAALPDMLTLPVGIFSSPAQPGYIDALAAQVDKIKQTAGNNTDLFQHAQNVDYALADLRDWIQKMRSFDVQILKAPDLTDPNLVSVALQLKQLAQDAYTGRTIPPNQGPRPILGSAGAYQAYVESQYMATLDIKKI